VCVCVCARARVFLKRKNGNSRIIIIIIALAIVLSAISHYQLICQKVEYGAFNCVDYRMKIGLEHSHTYVLVIRSSFDIRARYIYSAKSAKCVF
jgi:hypothetical protein